MALRAQIGPPPPTKNPGSLAGETGAPNGSAWRRELKKPYSIPNRLSSVPKPGFRAVLIAGRFVCLERANG